MAKLADAFKGVLPDAYMENMAEALLGPSVSTTPWLSELSEAMGYTSAEQIGTLAKALGPKMPNLLTKRAAAPPMVPTAPFLAEMARATNISGPAEIGRLARRLGPRMPRPMIDLGRPAAAAMIDTLAGTASFKELLAAMTRPLPGTSAQPVDHEPIAEQVPSVAEVDAVEATTSTAVPTHILSPSEAALTWTLAFFIVWMWWAANQLADLDRSGEMLQNMDKSELLDFAYSTVDLPSFLFGVSRAARPYVVKKKRK